jgi:serine/threonine-protein kinase
MSSAPTDLASPSPRELRAGDKLDGYELMELVARSGVASIFRAIYTATGETVALKVPSIQLENDADLFERVRREEEIGRRLDHPGIVKVLDTPAKSRTYVVMEYVPGKTLRELLREEKKLPTGRALEIARQLCDAVAYLHAHGIVHRSLKPENVVLTANGRLKVLGLGFALDQAARRLTWARLSSPLWQIEYLAPEQIEGRRGDARSDVYACGTILYEMLCGEVPFPRRDPFSVDPAKTFHDPRPLHELVPGIEPGLESIVLKCLRRAPRDRYATATELLDALRDPAAVPATPPAATPRLGLAAVLFLLAILAALGLLMAMT